MDLYADIPSSRGAASPAPRAPAPAPAPRSRLALALLVPAALRARPPPPPPTPTQPPAATAPAAPSSGSGEHDEAGAEPRPAKQARRATDDGDDDHGGGGGGAALPVSSSLSSSSSSFEAHFQPAAGFFDVELRDEYDPLRPHDYEAVLEERARDHERERAATARWRDEDRPPPSKAHEGLALAAGGVGAAASPPAAYAVSARGMDNRPAWMTRQLGASAAEATAGAWAGAENSTSFPAPTPSSAPAPAPAPAPTRAPAAGGAALRMMQKWGFTEGTGLGKDGRGIVAPLMHERTGRHSGIIRQASVVPLPRGQAAASLAGPAVASSRILLLTNMVLSSEVDDEVEGEVAEECARVLGGSAVRVDGVIVFVSADPAVAARIFVAFAAADDARACQRAFDGRYFGGRRVGAALFDEARHRRLDLAE